MPLTVSLDSLIFRWRGASGENLFQKEGSPSQLRKTLTLSKKRSRMLWLSRIDGGDMGEPNCFEWEKSARLGGWPQHHKRVIQLVGSPIQPSQHFVSHENNSPNFVRKCWKRWFPRGGLNRRVTPLPFHQGPRAVNREFKQQRRRRLRKRYLKSEFELPQSLSRLFHLV